MAIDPPYRLDPFQNIIGIHWETPTTVGPIYALFFWNAIGDGEDDAHRDGSNILNGWKFDSVWDWADTGVASEFFAKIADLEASGYRYAGEAYYMVEGVLYNQWPTLSLCQANAIDFSAYVHWASTHNFYGIWDMVNANDGLFHSKAFVQCSIEQITA